MAINLSPHPPGRRCKKQQAGSLEVARSVTLSLTVKSVEARIVMNLRKARCFEGPSPSPPLRDAILLSPPCHVAPTATVRTATCENQRSITALLRPRTDSVTDSVWPRRACLRRSKSPMIEAGTASPTQRLPWRGQNHGNSSDRTKPTDDERQELVIEKLCQNPTGQLYTFRHQKLDLMREFDDSKRKIEYTSAPEDWAPSTPTVPALGSEEYKKRRRERAARGVATLRKLDEEFERIDTLIVQEKRRMARELVQRLKTEKVFLAQATEPARVEGSAAVRRVAGVVNDKPSASRPAEAVRKTDKSSDLDATLEDNSTAKMFVERRPWRAAGVGLFAAKKKYALSAEPRTNETPMTAGVFVCYDDVAKGLAKLEIQQLLTRACKNLANRPWRLAGVRLVTDAAKPRRRGSRGRREMRNSGIAALARDVSIAVRSKSPIRVDPQLSVKPSAASTAGCRPMEQQKRSGRGGGYGRNRRLVRPRSTVTQGSACTDRLFLPLSPPRRANPGDSGSVDVCRGVQDEADRGRPGTRGGIPCLGGMQRNEVRPRTLVRGTLSCDRSSERLQGEGSRDGTRSPPNIEFCSGLFSASDNESPEPQESLDGQDSASGDRRRKSSRRRSRQAQDYKNTRSKVSSSPVDVPVVQHLPSLKRRGGLQGSNRVQTKRCRLDFVRRRVVGASGAGRGRGRAPSPPRRVDIARSSVREQGLKRPRWDSRFWLRSNTPVNDNRSPAPSERAVLKRPTGHRNRVDAAPPVALAEPICTPYVLMLRDKLAKLKRDYKVQEIGRETCPSYPGLNVAIAFGSSAKGRKEGGRPQSAETSLGSPAACCHACRCTELEENTREGCRSISRLGRDRTRNSDAGGQAGSSRRLCTAGQRSETEMILSELCVENFPPDAAECLLTTMGNTHKRCGEAHVKRNAALPSDTTSCVGDEVMKAYEDERGGGIHMEDTAARPACVDTAVDEYTGVQVSRGLLAEIVWRSHPNQREGDGRVDVCGTLGSLQRFDSDVALAREAEPRLVAPSSEHAANASTPIPQAEPAAEQKGALRSSMRRSSTARPRPATSRNFESKHAERCSNFVVLTLAFIQRLVESAEREWRRPALHGDGARMKHDNDDRGLRNAGRWKYNSDVRQKGNAHFPLPPQPPTPPWTAISAALRKIRVIDAEHGLHQPLRTVLDPMLMGALVRLIARVLRPQYPTGVASRRQAYSGNRPRRRGDGTDDQECHAAMVAFLGSAVRHLVWSGNVGFDYEFAKSPRRTERVCCNSDGNANVLDSLGMVASEDRESGNLGHERYIRSANRFSSTTSDDCAVMNRSTLPKIGLKDDDAAGTRRPQEGNRATLEVDVDDSSGGGYSTGTFIAEDASVSSFPSKPPEKCCERGTEYGSRDGGGGSVAGAQNDDNHSILSAENSIPSPTPAEVDRGSILSVLREDDDPVTLSDCLAVLAEMQQANSHLQIPGLGHDARKFAQRLGRLANGCDRHGSDHRDVVDAGKHAVVHHVNGEGVAELDRRDHEHNVSSSVGLPEDGNGDIQGKGVSDGRSSTVWDECSSLTTLDVLGDTNVH